MPMDLLLLQDSISAGAIGMSTGLIYAPGVFLEKDELLELCSVLSSVLRKMTSVQLCKAHMI